MSLRDEIKQTSRKPCQPVTAFGKELFARPISAGEKIAWETFTYGTKGYRCHPQGKAKLAVIATVDADGRQVFQAGDETWLADMDAGEVEKLYDAAGKLCGIGLTVEDAEKNSESSRSGSSQCGSRCKPDSVTLTGSLTPSVLSSSTNGSL